MKSEFLGRKRKPSLTVAYTFLVGSFLAGAAFPQSAPEAKDGKDDKEAMEVGGLLTVDRDNSMDDWGNAPMHLSRVELSANVNVRENEVGSITLLSDDDPKSIEIYQALGQLTLKETRILFGRQAFNLGLLSTRLISLPSMYDIGEFRADGLNVLWGRGALTLGAGGASITSETDSVGYHEPCFIFNADLAPAGQLLRLAFQVSPERQAVDLGGNFALGPLLLDAEGLWRWKDYDAPANGGYAVGLAWQATKIIQFATRWDGIGDKDNLLRDDRIAGGVTVSFIEHVFAAAEVSNGKSEGARFALQMGLQSTLALPGFRPKTLANPED